MAGILGFVICASQAAGARITFTTAAGGSAPAPPLAPGDCTRITDISATIRLRYPPAMTTVNSLALRSRAAAQRQGHARRINRGGKIAGLQPVLAGDVHLEAGFAQPVDKLMAGTCVAIKTDNAAATEIGQGLDRTYLNENGTCSVQGVRDAGLIVKVVASSLNKMSDRPASLRWWVMYAAVSGWSWLAWRI